MNNLTNYHSHCLYCDGVAPAEDFVNKEGYALVLEEKRNAIKKAKNKQGEKDK